MKTGMTSNKIVMISTGNTANISEKGLILEHELNEEAQK